MKTTHLVFIAIYLFLVMWTINPAKGRKLNVMSNLMNQADTLKHGLDLVSQVGNIGMLKRGCCMYTKQLLEKISAHFLTQTEKKLKLSL